MSETLWENEKTLWWHAHSKCFLNFIPYVLDHHYTLNVRSADGEFIHIMETKENKYFMYNSFQFKKVEHKMFNDSIIMFIRDCIQIIVYNK